MRRVLTLPPSSVGALKRGVRRSSLLRPATSTCQLKPLAPPSSSAEPAFSRAAPPRRTSARPDKPSAATRGMRLSMTLTTPPVALPPYSRAAGPRTISTRSATSGSSVTAWSKLRLDASTDAPPLSSMRTRSPSRPRMMGRLLCGPKPVAEMPGRPSSVSPSVPAPRSVRPSPDSTVTGWARLSRPSGLPVMTTVVAAAEVVLAFVGAVGDGAVCAPADSGRPTVRNTAARAPASAGCAGANGAWRKGLCMGSPCAGPRCGAAGD